MVGGRTLCCVVLWYDYCVINLVTSGPTSSYFSSSWISVKQTRVLSSHRIYLSSLSLTGDNFYFLLELLRLMPCFLLIYLNNQLKNYRGGEFVISSSWNLHRSLQSYLVWIFSFSLDLFCRTIIGHFTVCQAYYYNKTEDVSIQNIPPPHCQVHYQQTSVSSPQNSY